MRGPKGIARAVVRTVETKHEWRFSAADVRRLLKLPDGAVLDFVTKGEATVLAFEAGDSLLVSFTETKGAKAVPAEPSDEPAATPTVVPASVLVHAPRAPAAPRRMTVELPDGSTVDTSGNPK